MRAATLLGDLSMRELRALRRQSVPKPISDLDFLETLAAHRCILVPPWILRVRAGGGTQKIGLITYDPELNLEKGKILLKVMKAGSGRRGRG